MPRQKAADQIETLRRQQAEIAAKLKEAEAKDRERKRESDQRRKLIAGAVALDHLEAHSSSAFAITLLALLAEHVKRPADRALFPGLPSPAEPPAS